MTLRPAFAIVALLALPLVALANTVAPSAPGAGATKPHPRPSGGYPNGNNGYNRPQVYIDGTAFVTPRPKTSPQHHTNTVTTSAPQETFHSYGTGN